LTLLSRLVLLAADAPEAPASNLLMSLAPFLAIGLLFYFMLIKPQKTQQKRRLQMLSAVKKNDRVVTASGIYGVVANIDRAADEVTLKVDEATNTKIRMTLSSIAQVVAGEASEDTASK
jgi:preprotein translocase subunit YajC